MNPCRLGLAALATLLIAPAGAAQPAGMAFSHLDWELACDNTRTCRAAGYQRDDSGNDGKPLPPVSILLTRHAGPRTAVLAELQLRSQEGDEFDTDALRRLSLAMMINGRPLGQVVLKHDKGTLQLTPAQTAALLAALPGSARIAWSDGRTSWTLSHAGDHGAAAARVVAARKEC
ncbi:DUF1176 domain-containing protein [Massilia sp. PAMC28688]|uniref:DUF1176 domain-containing protein n=1 Tax=Massilia sp. PAMC28688 TaxID=2861283 RepID=UPI001C62F24E|nr:DUF1176 domain-containing protein [Massilia sp. PAMC28688]QYF95223.1 DUF1176 domain-containing protein [Massilia sp. PAMC28688]